MTDVRADVRSAQDPYARRRANHGQSTDDSPRCLPPAPGKAGIGAVGGMSRLWALGLRGSGGRDADGVYPRYRAGQGPLPVGSTQVETPRYPASDPAVSKRVRSTTPHPTRITQLGVNRCHSTGDALACPAHPTALIITGGEPLPPRP